jgi:segregation and condensation protein A
MNTPQPQKTKDIRLPSFGDDDIYRVRLEDIFEGPMDLLVHLIKKAEVDIYDIPIATITDQYIEYIEWLKQMDVDLAGDFILMASTLIQIKSKMLLPANETEEEEEDPRLEITRPLLEYLRIKSAAEQLADRDLLGDKTFIRKTDMAHLKVADSEQMVRIGLFELIDAFQNILDKATAGHQVNLSQDRISVQERITQLVDLLEAHGSMTFDELFEDHRDKSDIIVSFLAILEMAKLNLIHVVQHVPTGIIRLFYR